MLGTAAIKPARQLWPQSPTIFYFKETLVYIAPMDERIRTAWNRHLNTGGCPCTTCRDAVEFFVASGGTIGYPAQNFHASLPPARLMKEGDELIPNSIVIREWQRAQDQMAEFRYLYEKTQPTRGARTRIGDVDRDRVLAQLEKAFVGGYVDADEHMNRVETCLKAKYVEDLTPLTADLPKSALMNTNKADYIEHPRPTDDSLVSDFLRLWIFRSLLILAGFVFLVVLLIH